MKRKISFFLMQWWSGGLWRESQTSCAEAPAQQLDLIKRQLSAALCRTGTYGLFGPTNQLMLTDTEVTSLLRVE